VEGDMKKCIVSILAGLMTVSALLAQTDSLSTGKLKYEAAKARIESDALASYSNSLVAAMASLKQKGDLDTFLIVRKELERISVEKTIGSTNNPAAIINFNTAKFDAEKSQKVQALTKQYVAYLEGLIKQAMLANKIDDAKRIKAELDRVKFEQADSESKSTNVTNMAVQVEQKEEAVSSEVADTNSKTNVRVASFPVGTREYNGHHYFMIKQQKTWTAAKEYCESLSGHLVTFSDFNERKFCESLLPGYGQFWVGVVRKDNKWKWFDGKSVLTSMWAKRHPKAGKNYDFIHLQLHQGGDGLHTSDDNGIGVVGEPEAPGGQGWWSMCEWDY
jgi:hypothetical protein